MRQSYERADRDGLHENGFGGGRDDRLKDFGGFRRFLVSHCKEKRFPSLWVRVGGSVAGKADVKDLFYVVNVIDDKRFD